MKKRLQTNDAKTSKTTLFNVFFATLFIGEGRFLKQSKRLFAASVVQKFIIRGKDSVKESFKNI